MTDFNAAAGLLQGHAGAPPAMGARADARVSSQILMPRSAQKPPFAFRTTFGPRSESQEISECLPKQATHRLGFSLAT